MLDYIAAIRAESDAFYAAADKADPDARVPSCPDWAVRDLVGHLTEVHYFWRIVVEGGITDLSALDGMKHPSTPDDYGELLALGREMAERMVKTLEGADQSATVWSWAKQNDVAFVTRHQVQEAAIHRWDIQAATADGGAPIDPEVAADCIDEFLRVSIASRDEWKPPSDTVHIHTTDTKSDWFIEPGGNIENRPGSADVTLSATASDLLLALYRRIPLEDIDAILGGVEFT